MSANKNDVTAALNTDLERLLQKAISTKEPQTLEIDGSPRAVIQDYDSYEWEKERMALLEIILHGQEQIKAGEGVPYKEVFAELRRKHFR